MTKNVTLTLPHVIMVSVYILFLFLWCSANIRFTAQKYFLFSKRMIFKQKSSPHYIIENCQENQHLLLTGEAKNLNSMFGTLTYRSKIEPKMIFSQKLTKCTNVLLVLTSFTSTVLVLLKSKSPAPCLEWKCIDGDTVK